MSAVPIIRVQCNYCPRQVHPGEVVRIGDDVLMCWACWETHTEQVDCFNPPHECQVCHKSLAQLAAETPGDKLSMFPHWKDGTYQILCKSCDAAYVAKQRNLWKDTAFGWERKLW